MRLVREDFGTPPEGGKAGVLVWWVTEKKRKRMCISWPGLLIHGVKAEWPLEIAPKKIEGWGEDTQQILWVPEMARMIVRPCIPIPSVQDLLDLRPGGWPRAQFEHNVPRLRIRKLTFGAFDTEDERVWLVKRSIQRMTAAMGETRTQELDVRLVDPPWAPGHRMLCTWKRGVLRAAATCNREEDLTE